MTTSRGLPPFRPITLSFHVFLFLALLVQEAWAQSQNSSAAAEPTTKAPPAPTERIPSVPFSATAISKTADTKAVGSFAAAAAPAEAQTGITGDAGLPDSAAPDAPPESAVPTQQKAAASDTGTPVSTAGDANGQGGGSGGPYLQASFPYRGGMMRPGGFGSRQLGPNQWPQRPLSHGPVISPVEGRPAPGLRPQGSSPREWDWPRQPFRQDSAPVGQQGPTSRQDIRQPPPASGPGNDPQQTQQPPVYRDRPPVGTWRTGPQRLPPDERPYPNDRQQSAQALHPAGPNPGPDRGGWQPRPADKAPHSPLDRRFGSAESEPGGHRQNGPADPGPGPLGGGRWQERPRQGPDAPENHGPQGEGQGESPTPSGGRWQPRDPQLPLPGQGDSPAYNSYQKDIHHYPSHAEKQGYGPAGEGPHSNHPGTPYPGGESQPPHYNQHGGHSPQGEEYEAEEMEHPSQNKGSQWSGYQPYGTGNQHPDPHQRTSGESAPTWGSHHPQPQSQESQYPYPYPSHHDPHVPQYQQGGAPHGAQGGGIGGGENAIEPTPSYKWDPVQGRYVAILPDPATYKGDLEEFYEDIQEHLLAQGVPASLLPQFNHTSEPGMQAEVEEIEYEDLPPNYRGAPYPGQGYGYPGPYGQGQPEGQGQGSYNEGTNPDYRHQVQGGGYNQQNQQQPSWRYNPARGDDGGPYDPNRRGPPPIYATPVLTDIAPTDSHRVPPSQRHWLGRPQDPQRRVTTPPPPYQTNPRGHGTHAGQLGRENASPSPQTHSAVDTLSGRHGGQKVEVLLRATPALDTVPTRVVDGTQGTRETPAGQQPLQAEHTGTNDPGAPTTSNMTDPLQEQNSVNSENTSPAVTFGIVAGSIIGFWLIMGPIVCLACRHRDKVKEKEKRLLYRQNAASASSADHREVLETMVMTELGREPLTSLGQSEARTSRYPSRPSSEYVLAPQDPAELERLTSAIH